MFTQRNFDVARPRIQEEAITKLECDGWVQKSTPKKRVPNKKHQADYIPIT